MTGSIPVHGVEFNNCSLSLIGENTKLRIWKLGVRVAWGTLLSPSPNGLRHEISNLTSVGSNPIGDMQTW